MTAATSCLGIPLLPVQRQTDAGDKTSSRTSHPTYPYLLPLLRLAQGLGWVGLEKGPQRKELEG